jgi:hypothetical protein
MLGHRNIGINQHHPLAPTIVKCDDHAQANEPCPKQIVIHVISAELRRQFGAIFAKIFRSMAFLFSASLRVCGWHVKDAQSWLTLENGQHSQNALIRVSRRRLR